MIRAKVRKVNPAKKREMNQLEQDYYDEMLQLQVLAGEMRKVEFEGMSLKLKGSRFKPDFYCLLANGEIEFHETKGSWQAKNQRSARLQIRAAAELYPEFRFVAIQKGKNKREPRWKIEEF